MNRIKQAISLIESEIEKRKASCAIYTDTQPPESTIGGTRDGYLNLIRSLLQLVADSDASDRTVHWGDQIKSNMLMLPSDDTFLVGAEVFREHSELIARLRQMYKDDPDIVRSLENDPDFKEPKD